MENPTAHQPATPADPTEPDNYPNRPNREPNRKREEGTRRPTERCPDSRTTQPTRHEPDRPS
ncbi:hypothetical protein HMPREF0682_2275 [Propionibacterium acidifaciens F0233]|uniref:Uncharacterized protein n=1 Tax=Propionibacterium acidifaciens F0233 TaxID=553198 RepID=U2QEW7_9ACTN|nr:hypothetical protein HMPREF0682_2275 [Propionibacterium acidifaciens F0233]